MSNSRQYIKGHSHFSTNNVLIQKKKQTQMHVHFPAYFKLNFHNFLDIDLANLTSVVDVTLNFNVYYGDFFKSDDIFQKESEYLRKTNQSEADQARKIDKNKNRTQTNKEYVIGKLMRRLRFNFTQDEAIYLSQEQNDNESLHLMKIQHLEQESMIEYEIRKTFNIQLQGDLTWSPFEILHSILEITVQPLILKIQGNIQDKIQEKTFNFKVNIMESIYDSEFFIDENTAIGEYSLASSYVDSVYSNYRVPAAEEFKMSSLERGMHLMQKYQEQLTGLARDENGNIKVKEPDTLWFQYAIFDIPMYKHPMASIITVFIPLWLLGLINLGIFFQDQSLSDRVGSIIGLMIAFITYIPTIQQSIPPSSRIVFVEIIVYCQSLAVLCTFIHSIRIMNFDGQKFLLIWTQTPEYIIAFIILILSFGMVFTLMIVHYAHWRRNYSRKRESLRSRLNKEFDIELEINNQQKGMINGQERLDNQKEKSTNKIKQDYQEEQQESKDNQDIFLEQLANILGPYHSPNKIVKSSFSQKFNRHDWSNILCDIYFNYFFSYRKEQIKDKNAQNSSGKQYYDYFLIDSRKLEDYKISENEWFKHPLKKIAEKSQGVDLRSDKLQFIKLKLSQSN